MQIQKTKPWSNKEETLQAKNHDRRSQTAIAVPWRRELEDSEETAIAVQWKLVAGEIYLLEFFIFYVFIFISPNLVLLIWF